MIDMHIHTINSDGELTVEQLLEKIIKKQIEIFSITDHDNINACIEMEKIKIPKNMIYIPGIELSAELKNINCHILGYNIDYRNYHLLEICKIIKIKKYKKIKTILENLKEAHNIKITQEEKDMIFKKQGTFGRMDICNILLNRGYGTISEIYKKYLTITNIETHRIDAKTIIQTIKNAQGQAILAHPKEIEEDYNINIEDIIEEYLKIGLDGIEVYNTIHTLKDIKRYLEIAKKYDLLTTAGSDFHGCRKPERILGYTTTEHIKIKKNQINFPL